MFPIQWLLSDLGWHEANGNWADFRHLPTPPKSLPERLVTACEHYPCDLLFVHRDAETKAVQFRVNEIRKAIATSSQTVPHVCVVPVRMLEAWLLHDIHAIRRAAGNPNGSQALNLPTLDQVENIADPKQVLREALLSAVATTGRRRRRAERDFGVNLHRVADLIKDYSPLRQLSAFTHFESTLRQALALL